MKQKHSIMRSDDKSRLIIQEFAELDKDVMSLLCEESYDFQSIKSAIKTGKESLISALRTPNMYPAMAYADKIADSVMALQDSSDQDSTELFFDDFDLIGPKRAKAKKVVAIEDTIEEDAVEINELLEDEFDEDFDEKPSININTPLLKVEEDDMSDMEESA
jgi:hypothetical protein